MKLKHLLCGIIITLALTPVINVFASTQDFYFEDFTADYYLTKLEDGTSNLHVREVLTAVFPETDQNHGITRQIPYENQGGENRTVLNKDALNITVLRNGESEPINKITENNGYYTVYIGTASEYVHGRQVYTLEYDFTDVITEFDAEDKNVSGMEGIEKVFQELYWDTNGTGWKQRFDKVTARLHVPEDVYGKMDEQAWCYVGKYGAKGSDRCTIVPTDDGFDFMTENLAIGENLTFVTKFQPDTFEVILEKNYILVVLLVIEIAIVVIITLRKIIKWCRKVRPQYNVYRSTFVAPQYLPPKDADIHVAEGEQIYLKRKIKASYVATLLELAVSKAILIKKIEGDRKSRWGVTVNVDPKTLSDSQKQVLNILSGDGGLTKDDYIPIKKHKATSFLASCARSYKEDAVDILKNNGYMKREITKYRSRSLVTYLIVSIMTCMIVGAFPAMALLKMSDDLNVMRFFEEKMIIVGENVIPLLLVIIFIGAILVNGIIKTQIDKYIEHTEDGVKLARYLEGLELYIKMAEEDRLKFLQSVEGVDTSNDGIVKLYEKLLPWASLFGVEKSWIKELSKYYEIENVTSALNSDVVNGIITANIIHDVNVAVSSSIDYVSHSSGGFSSSGDSGGSWSSSSSGSSSSGGGGFSGGGGGGGGGGGW